MKLGSRQYDVLVSAAHGSACTMHSGQGRMWIGGCREPYGDDVLDRVLELGLVELGVEQVAGHRLRLTAAGIRELALRRITVDPGHVLTVYRTNLGKSMQGGVSFGTVGRCSCGGWSDRVNVAPTSGGRVGIIGAYAAHVASVVL